MRLTKIPILIMFMLFFSIFAVVFTEKFPKSVEIFAGDWLQLYVSAAEGNRCVLFRQIKLVAELRDCAFLETSEIMRLVLSKGTENGEFVYLSVETQLMIGPNEEFTTDGRLYPLGSSTNLSTLCITLQIIGSNESRKIEEFKLDVYESFDGTDRFILLEVKMSGRKSNRLKLYY